MTRALVFEIQILDINHSWDLVKFCNSRYTVHDVIHSWECDVNPYFAFIAGHGVSTVYPKYNMYIVKKDLCGHLKLCNTP